MSWKDSLHPASFRGVPFLYESTDKTGGRRHAEHPFPGRDDVLYEDMGRAPRVYSMRAYVLGDDYMVQRNTLERALEEEGPGKLVHPYRGELQVVVREYREEESPNAGREARFSITFAETAENRFPTSAIDTRVGTRTSADQATATIENVFGRVFNASSKTNYLTDSAVGLVNLAATDMQSLSGRVLGQTAGASSFISQLSGFRSAASSLVRSPSSLASQVTGLVQSLVALGAPLDGGLFWTRGQRTAPVGVARSLQSFGSSLDPVPNSTASRARQAQNQDAFVSLVRRSALIEESRISADIEFDNRDDAVAFRDDLASRLDDEILAVEGDDADEIYAAFTDLRLAVVRDMTARSTQLVRLAHYTPDSTQPALVIAHRLYGDDPTRILDRAEDLTVRNRVRHPGFIGGGRELEILDNG